MAYFRLYPSIFLEGLRKTKYLRLVGVLSEKRTRNYPNTSDRSFRGLNVADDFSTALETDRAYNRERIYMSRS